MAIKETKVSVHVTLDHRLVDVMDKSIEEINKQGENEIDFTKVTRSSFISTMLIAFYEECQNDKQKQNKKGNKKDA